MFICMCIYNIIFYIFNVDVLACVCVSVCVCVCVCDRKPKLKCDMDMGFVNIWSDGDVYNVYNV